MLAAVRQHGAKLKQLGAAFCRLEDSVGTLTRSDDTNFVQKRNLLNQNESNERKLGPSPWVLEQRHRQYVSFLPGFDEDTKKYYHERKLLGYSPEQMFAVVSNVENYREFVPWCQTSTVLYTSEDGKYLEAELEVGFQVFVERWVVDILTEGSSYLEGVIERFPSIGGLQLSETQLDYKSRSLIWRKYVSQVTLNAPHEVKTHTGDSTLFSHLDSNWKLSPGPSAQSVWVDFTVDFEFKSALYRHVASLFFEEVVKKMMSAFESRCNALYGPTSLRRRAIN